MDVTKVITTDYEKKTLGGAGKNEPKRTQTNPIFNSAQKPQVARLIDQARVFALPSRRLSLKYPTEP